MTSLPLNRPTPTDRDLHELDAPTLARMPFRDRLIDKLADLLVAAAEVIDVISESTSSRCAETERPEREADEAFRSTTTAQIARTVETIYEEVNRLMLGMTD